MKRLKYCVLAISLMSASVMAIQGEIVPFKRGRVSKAYHHTCDKLCKHKGKACFAAGAIGATIFSKAFSYELNTYLRPFIKSLFTKTYDFFKRIFVKEKKV